MSAIEDGEKGLLKAEEFTTPPRVPAAAGDVEVNFCKRPTCTNFGVPASLNKYARRASAPASLPGTQYRLLGGGTAKNPQPMLHCLLCSEYPTIKSNQGVAEELARMEAYLVLRPRPSCTDAACANHGAAAPDKMRYQRFGKNSQGNPRFRCRACGVGGHHLLPAEPSIADHGRTGHGSALA